MAMWRNKAGGIVLMGGVAAAGAAWLSLQQGDSRAVLSAGRALYAEHCAACHGADLEGQPDWKMPLASGRLPAPPHDASGHTWHHSDKLLRRIVSEGTVAVVGEGYETDMPGFGDQLNEAQIDAILSFIKSKWPRREREYQRALTQAESD